MRTRSTLPRTAPEPSAPAPVGFMPESAATVTVTWGKETFTPVRFNSFDVGPFSITVARVPGEELDELRKRAQAHLERIAEEEFDRKLRAHLGRVRRAADVARATAAATTKRGPFLAGEDPDNCDDQRAVK